MFLGAYIEPVNKIQPVQIILVDKKTNRAVCVKEQADCGDPETLFPV
jgi:hypothetical protein